MKVFVITPLDKGYRVDTYMPDTKEAWVSGHNTRKEAINFALKNIPREKQFQIVMLDEE